MTRSILVSENESTRASANGQSADNTSTPSLTDASGGSTGLSSVVTPSKDVANIVSSPVFDTRRIALGAFGQTGDSADKDPFSAETSMPSDAIVSSRIGEAKSAENGKEEEKEEKEEKGEEEKKEGHAAIDEGKVTKLETEAGDGTECRQAQHAQVAASVSDGGSERLNAGAPATANDSSGSALPAVDVLPVPLSSSDSKPVVANVGISVSYQGLVQDGVHIDNARTTGADVESNSMNGTLLCLRDVPDTGDGGGLSTTGNADSTADQGTLEVSAGVCMSRP